MVATAFRSANRGIGCSWPYVAVSALLAAVCYEPVFSPMFTLPRADPPELHGVLHMEGHNSHPAGFAHMLLNTSEVFTPNTTIVVVGSSGNMHGMGFGPAIDSHDLVLRINAAPTFGFEADVGYRTDVRVAWEGGLRDSSRRKLKPPALTTAIVTTMGGAWSGLKMDDVEVSKLASAVAVTNRWSRRLYEWQLAGHAFPSTGFQAIAFAVAMAQRAGAPPPSVYGFGRCPCNRYYDCNSNKSDFQSWVTEEMLGKNGGRALARAHSAGPQTPHTPHTRHTLLRAHEARRSARRSGRAGTTAPTLSSPAHSMPPCSRFSPAFRVHAASFARAPRLRPRRLPRPPPHDAAWASAQTRSRRRPSCVRSGRRRAISSYTSHPALISTSCSRRWRPSLGRRLRARWPTRCSPMPSSGASRRRAPSRGS
jgi:hypothetical protein